MSPIAVMEREAVALTGTPPETPSQKRERLRQQVRQRGLNPFEIETIDGDCEAQTAQQIRDLEACSVRS